MERGLYGLQTGRKKAHLRMIFLVCVKLLDALRRIGAASERLIWHRTQQD